MQNSGENKKNKTYISVYDGDRVKNKEYNIKKC